MDVNLKTKKSVLLSSIIFYVLLLALFLFFGDRVGWEGDDVEQLEGIVNFAYKGKDLVYRYYWQPLTYEVNLGLMNWLDQPKLLFIIPQILGATNIFILLTAVYLFAQKRLNIILCFSFLIVFPELFFSGLYYNSTVYAMVPMAIASLFLFWQKSPLKSIQLWNNIRYFILGITLTTAIFFRFDFVLAFPLIWGLMLFDKSLKQRFKNYGIYAGSSFVLLGIFWLTDIFNPQQLINIAKSHEEGAANWTMAESWANLWTITNLLIWFLLIIALIYFVIQSIKSKQWKPLILIVSSLIILYPLPTLTSPKYLIPGIIFLPFILARMALEIKDKLTKKQFQGISLTFIALSVCLQIVSIHILNHIPFIAITPEPTYTATHDGPRVSGAYLTGYNKVRQAQIDSLHPPIKFARQMAKALEKPDKNVTAIYLDKDDNIATEQWIWTFSSLYLRLEGYQVNYYDRDSKIQLSLGDKTVLMEKVPQETYDSYVTNETQTKLIKVPYFSRQDPQVFEKIFTDYYQSLENI
ncbi:hypothetical protein [Cyanothece sp. BG0011]|uniref:hypothetical protein n=1 Tax=Cyanothece sp. BG0011 TaxID=2082950 RepID=UPI000D1ED096|nr:hypothetical protein [Cyanothece sp. BG0011]